MMASRMAGGTIARAALLSRRDVFGERLMVGMESPPATRRVWPVPPAGRPWDFPFGVKATTARIGRGVEPWGVVPARMETLRVKSARAPRLHRCQAGWWRRASSWYVRPAMVSVGRGWMTMVLVDRSNPGR